MSRLRLYKEDTLETLVSLADSFAAADETDSLDADAGEVDVAELWAATEQTTLAETLDDSAVYLSLTAARFAGETYLVLQCEDEQMLVTADGGTTAPRVERGYNNTDAVEHAAGARVYAAYDYQRATIEAVETGTPDSDYAVEYSLDGVTYATKLSLGYISMTGSVKIWRRVTVSAGAPGAIKTDIIHRLAAGIDQMEAA